MNELPGTSHAVRAGPEFRLNPSRYFHVMGEGWYVHTREGAQGPFLQRMDAQQWLQKSFVAPTSGMSEAKRQSPDPWSQSRR